MSGLMRLMNALEVTGSIDDPMFVWNLIAPDNTSLVEVKRMSKRIGTWFKKLSFKERRLMELVILVVEKIRSRLLLRLLAPIVMKLLTAILERSTRADPIRLIFPLIRDTAYGKMREIARKIRRLAISWGNESAKEWYKDGDSIEYLVINRLYSPPNS